MKVKSKEDQGCRYLEVGWWGSDERDARKGELDSFFREHQQWQLYEWYEKLLTRDGTIRRMAALEDPSAIRDREHKAAPLPARTPFDHFPDLKGWRVSGFDSGVDDGFGGRWRKTIK